MELQSMDAALKAIYAPRKPSLDQDGDTMIMRCSTCGKETRFDKGGDIPKDWRIVCWTDVNDNSTRHDPFCLPCFERAKAIRDGMVSVGLLPE